jgi:hypothetical protein
MPCSETWSKFGGGGGAHVVGICAWSAAISCCAIWIACWIPLICPGVHEPGLLLQFASARCSLLQSRDLGFEFVAGQCQGALPASEQPQCEADKHARSDPHAFASDAHVELRVPMIAQN